MSADGLFHIGADEQLVAMKATPYAAEDVLQQLLATHPDLLAGGQITPAEPRRWALVQREQGVPDRGDSIGTRWSLDQLFVDQEGVPTLVEVERSTDTRIRREVVGQMLDYAANGIRYWPTESLQAAFTSTQQAMGQDPQAAITALTQDETVSVVGFFEWVADNLRAGRIRMVFVADLIPDELRRIVEFLNEQMNPAEVFAVEVKQYLAEGYPGKVIVPTLYGRTAAASRKSSSPRIDPQQIRAEASAEAWAAVRHLQQLADVQGLETRETPSGLQLKTADGATVGEVYMQYNTLDIPLDAARGHGHDDEIEQMLTLLRGMTAKRLTRLTPAVPVADALTNWANISNLLIRLAALLSART